MANIKIGKKGNLGIELAGEGRSLLGIATEMGECGGCGGDVFVLRVGFLFGEIYYAHHEH